MFVNPYSFLEDVNLDAEVGLARFDDTGNYTGDRYLLSIGFPMPGWSLFGSQTNTHFAHIRTHKHEPRAEW